MVLARVIRVVVSLALATLLLTAVTSGQRTRTVKGKVHDANGTALKGAVVQIKNTRSLGIRSYISQDDGSYQFVSLSLDWDYEVRASFRGRWSSTQRVSRFNSKEVVEVDLVVPLESDDGRRAR
jgi:hypothetical protein